MKVVSVVISALFLCSLNLVPARILGKDGPLYASIKLLIAAESNRAMELGNVTLNQLNAQLYFTQDTLDMINKYQNLIMARFAQILNKEKTSLQRACYKQFEREVAHFNRELSSSFQSCKNSLENILEQFEANLHEEINFIGNAAQYIEKIADDCQISSLKQAKGNQAGVLLCVLAGIGGTNQRLAESMDLCNDLLLDLLDAIENVHDEQQWSTASCRSYMKLKQQFDEIYENILMCENK